ncbi:MAG: hypothetical protein ACTHW2_09555 [Tissierella sp.]|uniref:hypothetical protein n=1 Tax=Tissierella sp. TaxID=41274 RepID=UPI003F9430D9
MSAEEFQSIVLEELKALREGQDEIKVEQQAMKKEQQEMKLEQKEMKKEQQIMKLEQQEMKRDLKAVIEQTAQLTEFKEEVNNKIDTMIDEINTLAMIVSKNWQDITKIRAAR